MRTPKAKTVHVDVEHMINPMNELLGYTARTWGKHDASEIVIRITEYVLGLSPGGLHQLLRDMVVNWGIPINRAQKIVTLAIFPLDGALKPVTIDLAERPAVVKMRMINQTLEIAIHPLSPGESYGHIPRQDADIPER